MGSKPGQVITTVVGEWSAVQSDTGQWRQIPQAHDPVQWVPGESGLSISSTWTAAGFFLWGTLDEATLWGALLNVDTLEWKDLRVHGSDMPPVRLGASLLSIGDEVFLHNGYEPVQGEPGREVRSRRMWRYSLSNDAWKEIAVPSWVDPTEPGAVFHGKVAFLGQCAGGALFDPKTDTWQKLTGEGGPPESGRLSHERSLAARLARAVSAYSIGAGESGNQWNRA